MVMRINRSKKLKIAILLTLLVIIAANTFVSDFSSSNLVGDEIDESMDSLKRNDLSFNNEFTGAGSAWNVTHWANRTDSNMPVSFGNDTSDTIGIPLGIGWAGYRLNATINNLYDERNWINGTFEYGNDDGDYSDNDDDTNWITNGFQNWSFYSFDGGSFTNLMTGNYLDSTYGDSDGHDCLEIDFQGQHDVGWERYDQGDRAWWNSSFQVPRGNVIDSELKFDVNPNYLGNFDSWKFAISINGIQVYSIGSYTLKQMAGEGNWLTITIPQTLFQNQSIYASPLDGTDLAIEISLEYTADSASYSDGFTHIDHQEIFIDNIELKIKAETTPSLISLKMNNTSVNDIDWGEGTIELYGNWKDTNNVMGNFSSDDIWGLGSYDISFLADLNLYTIKKTPSTYYETNFASEGTSFSVSNSTVVDWSSYAYFAVPSGYKENNFTLTFPTDVTITWVSEPQQPTTNRLAQCDTTTPGVLFIPVDAISVTPDGFWKFEGTSSNYLEQLTIYKNSTNSPTGVDWVQNHEFLSGDYINITAKVNPSPLVSSYITQTNAIMNIRFPNGTIWTAKNQITSCDSNGMVYFDYFQVPLNTPNYEVGEYDVIITWNNSYSNFGLNESGVIHKKFTVNHFSSLTPDQSYYPDILEGSTINLIVSFTDRENGDAIENAILYLHNFTGGIEYFNEINPGFYALLDFNTTGGVAGDNLLTIYGNSSLYENNAANVSINLILKTSLVAEEFPFLQATWNDNFTIHLNYTEASTGNGISTSPTSNWLGEYSTVMVSPGLYNMTFSTSVYEVNKIYSLVIDVNESNYELQTILLKVEITERETYIDEITLNGDVKLADKSITLTSGELLNISIKYKDKSLDNFISGASAIIIGGSISDNFTENLIFNHYEFVFNTSELQIGATFLTISAQIQNYSASADVITVYIGERGTTLDVLLNGTTYPDNYINIEVWESINITVKFNDLITGNFLTNADIELLGHGNFTESLGLEQYTYILNASLLEQGIDILNIIALKDNYESQPAQVTVEITERKTDIQLYLNGVNKTTDPFLEIPIGTILNITIIFSDLLYNFISGADVVLLGEGLDTNLTEIISLNHYTLLLNTRQLDIGVRLLTILAQKNNYQVQTIDIRLDVRRIKTNISTLSGASIINISPGQPVHLEIILTDLDFGGSILNASLFYRWALDDGIIEDLNNDGIYEVTILNIPDGSYTFTITAFAGDDYDFERFEITVTVIRPSEETLLFLILLIVSSIATVSALTYLYLYQKVFKYPKPVRKVRKYSKTLRKTNDPRVDITAREKAFKVEYQNDLAKTSKLLKGKPTEITSKPNKMLKEPIEGSDK